MKKQNRIHTLALLATLAIGIMAAGCGSGAVTNPSADASEAAKVSSDQRAARGAQDQTQTRKPPVGTDGLGTASTSEAQ